MSKAAELAALIGSGQAQGDRNLIINGAATVHQRGNQTSSNGSGVYFVDRWNMYHNSGALAANLQQSTVVPSGQGFSNSILVDCTTVDSSVGAAEIAILRQVIEGQNLQRLAYGTSGAKSLTISFWVRSTKTGIYVLDIYHADATARTQSHQYTISEADTWEYKTITFSGDTSIAADNDNADTFYVQWGLMAGSNFTSGTLQTTWANATNANRFVGQVNFFDSTSNNFYLTGVQMEVGDVATPFEHEDIGTTLDKCQRYFTIEKAGTGGTYKRLAMGQCISGTSAGFVSGLSTPLRATPTLVTSGAANHYATYSAAAVDACTAIVLTNDSDAGTYNRNVAFNVTTSSGLVAGEAASLVTNNNESYYLAFDAEL